jgi:hypothetical protein
MINKLQENEQFSLFSGAAINGDEVVGFMSPKTLKTVSGYLDKPTVFESMYSPYDENSHIVHLGMINLMRTANKIHLPMMNDLLQNNAVLKVPEGGVVRYKLPVPRVSDDVAVVTVNTLSEGETLFAGVPFKLVLDKPFTAGDLLKPDPTREYQLKVSEDFPVEPYGGDSYLHYVIMQPMGGTKKSFPASYLQEGTPFFKIGHKTPEYGTQFSTPTGMGSLPAYLELEWTPSDVTTIETGITRKADLMATRGARMISDQLKERLEDKLIDMGGFDSRGAFITADLNENKDGIKGSTLKVSTTLEYLAMAELHKMEAWTNMFATKSVDHGSAGVAKVNDGLWRQMRRGTVIEYARPGGIKVADLAMASESVFGTLGIPWNQRELVFTGGQQAVLNGEAILQEFGTTYIAKIQPGLTGTESIFGKTHDIVKGEIDNLSIEREIKIGKMLIPGVGLVSFEHDPTYDWNIGTTNYRASGFAGQGFNRTTYTLTLKSANVRSNDVTKKVTGADLVKDGEKNNNIYLVQPDGVPYVTTGKTQGRMQDGNKFSNVSSSSKYMASEFWAIIDTDVLLVDTTKCVIIELKDTFL